MRLLCDVQVVAGNDTNTCAAIERGQRCGADPVQSGLLNERSDDRDVVSNSGNTWRANGLSSPPVARGSTFVR